MYREGGHSMSEMTKEEKERVERMNHAFLYELGYQHMNHICEEADALKEECNDLEMPESLNTWFDDFNEKRLADEKREKQKKRLRKGIIRFAAGVLILLISAGAVTMSVEAFRVRFFNMLIDTKDTYSEISFETEDDYLEGIPEDWTNYYAMTYIPDGFTLSEVLDPVRSIYMTYENMDFYIIFIQESLEVDSQIDTENRKIETITIGKDDGIIVKSNEEIMLIWNNDELCFSIISNLDEDTIIKIAENIKKIQ
jgi:hypothetical protein